LRSEMSEKLRSKLSQLSTGQIAEIRGQAIEALRQYAVNQVMSLPAEVLIVSGRKK
jgi:hypothetical protein